MRHAKRFALYHTSIQRNLDDIMSEDHVIRVHEDGSVSDAEPGIYAPDVYATYDDHGTEHVTCEGDWKMEHGWSSQYAYQGPVMHATEYVGGTLADHILATPGLWTITSVYRLEDDEDADGWVACHRSD